MAPGGDWTEAEMVRFTNRQRTLERIGMIETEAANLAERMLQRDRLDSGDNRRICLECKRFKKGRCQSPQVGHCTVPTLLQRCDGFVAKGAV